MAKQYVNPAMKARRERIEKLKTIIKENNGMDHVQLISSFAVTTGLKTNVVKDYLNLLKNWGFCYAKDGKIYCSEKANEKEKEIINAKFEEIKKEELEHGRVEERRPEGIDKRGSKRVNTIEIS